MFLVLAVIFAAVWAAAVSQDFLLHGAIHALLAIAIAALAAHYSWPRRRRPAVVTEFHQRDNATLLKRRKSG